MVEKKLSYKIDYVTNFKESGFDSLMKKQVQLQQSIVSTNKIATRLASGKGRVTGQDLADSQTFLSSKMTDFQKQNLAHLASIDSKLQYTELVGKDKKEEKVGFWASIFGNIENRRSKGLFRSKTDIFKPTGATSPGGFATSILTGINPMLTIITAAAVSILAILIGSSKMLQRTLGNIMKFIMMLIRPIGDMLAVLLYPLMMVLRPFALMINTLVRPFLTEARKSFRLSLQLGRQAGTARDLGMIDEADRLTALSKDMFGTGLSTILMGLGVFIVNIAGEALKVVSSIILDNVFLLVGLLTGQLNVAKNGLLTLSPELESLKNSAKAFVDSGITGAIESFSSFANNFLEVVAAKNEAVNTLATYTGNWLSIAQKFPTDATVLTTVKDAVSGLLDDIEKAQLTGTADAFKTAKTNMETLGETVTTVIDGLIEKYDKSKDDSSSAPGGSMGFGSGGGNGAGAGGGGAGGDDSDWWSSTISILTGLFTDLTSPLDEVQKIISGDFAGAFVDFVAGPMDELIIAYGQLQQAAMDLHGEGGHGFVELQTEVSKNITSMNLFKESTTDAVSAIDKAVTSAKNFAADAAASASRAAAISKMNDDSEGGMATGGSIDQNGMYYLHRGETVTNPVDSSFKNTSGGSGGGNITINMQGSTFGNFNEWKREMDKYFSQQMRHMR